ncbi:MAG: hypothetical protein U0Q55_20170 [Vicinamibacterales bacterium]
MALVVTLALAAVIGAVATLRLLRRRDAAKNPDEVLSLIASARRTLAASARALERDCPALTSLEAAVDRLETVFHAGPRTGWTFDLVIAVDIVVTAAEAAMEALPATDTGLYDFLTSCRAYLRRHGVRPEPLWVESRCPACGYVEDGARCRGCGGDLAWCDRERQQACCTDCGEEFDEVLCQKCGSALPASPVTL